VTGAAVTPEPILQAWNEQFTPLSEGYGLTEAAPVVFMNPLPGKGVQKTMSCGVPIVPEIKVGVVNDDGKPVAVGEVGELIIQGPNVMKVLEQTGGDGQKPPTGGSTRGTWSALMRTVTIPSGTARTT
jgi:acyl-CoA synthetase (AMP-forming)/AMP-acid ligase II